MYKKSVCILILFLWVISAKGSDFASELMKYKGPFGLYPYNDPNAVLGKPTTWLYDDWEEKIYACSLVCGSYGVDPNRPAPNNELITTINNDANIVVKFDHKVADDPCNLYGIDFIVFGNSFFEGQGYLTPDTNMEEYLITSPVSIWQEPVKVSVAQDSGGPWYLFTNGPYGDTVYPTNAFEWDRNTHNWGKELNWLKPVNPALNSSNFAGLSVADAIELYEGSTGGTGFDLKDLEPDDYDALTVDPCSSQKWIQYIKVEYKSSYTGEIDGFSDVACCGDYAHPFAAGDIDKNCRVNMPDFVLLAKYWRMNVSGPNDPAKCADVYGDNVIDFRDVDVLKNDWLECVWECQ